MSEPLLSAHDGVLLDLDGTVYHGSTVIGGAPEAITKAREAGVGVRFVTNNAAKAPAAVAASLRGIGIPAEASEVHTSSQAAAAMLADRLPAGSQILVVGTESLAKEVTAAGLRPVREAAGAVAVVQGHSPDTAWRHLAEACLAIRDGALWIACNSDPTLPSERGELPGNGSMVAALRAATGVEPMFAGKPEPPLFRMAAEAAGCRNALVVGDRLETDIAGASAAGLPALAVLSGVGTPRALLAAEPAGRPRYLAEDLRSLDASVPELAVGPRPGWRVRQEAAALTVFSTGDDTRAPGLDLLRCLCDIAWRTGTTATRAGDPAAGQALTRLDLPH